MRQASRKTEQEIAKELRLLRHNLEEYRRALSAERARLARLPRTGFVIVEREEG